MLLLALAARAQEQQPAKDVPNPETTAPQNSQTASPAPHDSAPGTDTKSSPEPEKQDQTNAQEEKTAQPEPARPPATSPETASPQAVQPPKTACTNCEAEVPAKPSPSKQKKRKKPGSSANAHKQPKKNASSATSSASQAGKVVIRNGGAKGDAAQLSPAGNQEQALHNRENTAQLLATTDENLKRLAGRQLSLEQQSTLDQIRSYIRQSNAASEAGDLARARTLAYKAHLLSDDLARQ